MDFLYINNIKSLFKITDYFIKNIIYLYDTLDNVTYFYI